MTNGNDGALVPFGKYRGQPVELLLADDNYVEWIMGQPGLVQKLQKNYPVLFNIITVGGPQTDDTPDHNRLQANFLDRSFQEKFISACGFDIPKITAKLTEKWKEAIAASLCTCLKEIEASQNYIEQRIETTLEDLRKAEEWKTHATHYLATDGRFFTREHQYYRQNISAENKPDYLYDADYCDRQIDELKNRLSVKSAAMTEADAAAEYVRSLTGADFQSPTLSIEAEFECHYDVDLTFEWCAEHFASESGSPHKHKKLESVYRKGRIAVEIKPQMGDDFPSVLRQMKNNEAEVLYLGSFQAKGANLEQVRAMFGNRKIILAKDLE